MQPSSQPEPPTGPDTKASSLPAGPPSPSEPPAAPAMPMPTPSQAAPASQAAFPPPPAPPGPPSAGWGRQRGPAPGLIYAGLGVRLVAWIIDAVIVGLVGSVIAGALGLGFIGFNGADWRDLAFWNFRSFGGAWFAWLVVQAVISGAYFVYSWTRLGATLGQRFMNLHVHNDADGGLLTQDQAIRRWALLVVPLVGSLPGLGLLVFLYQLYLGWTTTQDPYKRGFHDHQSGTVVVEAV